MLPAPDHRIVAATAFRVPPPFRAFAVRSEELRHAFEARAPYDRVHLVRTDFLDPAALARLTAAGAAGVRIDAFCDVDYANTTWQALGAAVPSVPDLPARLARALQSTGVLGEEAAPYLDSLATRIDFLGARGAGFHNDVRGHWSRCLFWLLVLDATEVEFVMPHAGVQMALEAGDLIVFDPALAHGLCRAGDHGVVLESSFPAGAAARQLFLTGELPLDDARWAALGAPWLPVEEHERRGALDLLVAQFDERTGAIQQLRALRDGMRRSICYVDAAGP